MVSRRCRDAEAQRDTAALLRLRTTAALLALTWLAGGCAPTHAGNPGSVASPPASPAAVGEDTVVSRLAAVLDTLVPAELRATRTPGAAVAVVIGDSVVYAKGFGVASVETNEPVTPATLFRI